LKPDLQSALVTRARFSATKKAWPDKTGRPGKNNNMVLTCAWRDGKNFTATLPKDSFWVSSYRQGGYIRTAMCFGPFRYVSQPGDVIELVVPDSSTEHYLIPINRIAFPGVEHGRQVVDWWWGELQQMGLELDRGEGVEANACKFEVKSGQYVEALVKLTLLDLSQRSPVQLWAYSKLRAELPDEDPWMVFQLACMLPYYHLVWPWQTGEVREDATLLPAEVTKDHLLWGTKLDVMDSNHNVSALNGVFALTPTFNDAMERVLKHGAITGYFVPLGDDACPSPAWTFAEYAEWGRKYIEAERELF
jgi:hypothetical protein